jgi:hypothetical protein
MPREADPGGRPEAASSRSKHAGLVGRSPVTHARVAGLLGVAALVTGSFAGIVAGRLLVRGDAAATARRILASESLFRLGLVAGVLMMIAFLLYGIFLHLLLRRVHERRSLVMLGLVVASVPLYILNQLNLYAVFLLAEDQKLAEAKLFLDLHRVGNLIAGIFFGLWLFPLGLLVYKSGFLPRVLGVLLAFGSLGYLVLFAQAFLFPGSERTLWTNPFLLVTHFSELALMLWLLVRGVNTGEWDRRTLESA